MIPLIMQIVFSATYLQVRGSRWPPNSVPKIQAAQPALHAATDGRQP